MKLTQRKKRTPQGRIPTYHDYVIRNGRFIGKFEEMYTRFDDPWMQSKQPNPYSRAAGILYLKTFGIKSVLECGSGLGYYSAHIFRETGIVPIGIDISATAVQKAKKRFPHLHFKTGNAAKDLGNYTQVDCVLFAELLWYILSDLDDVLTVLKKNFKGKYLLINQVFYKGTQLYGREYFTRLDELIAYLPFQLLAKCEATTAADNTIETSSVYRIGQKKSLHLPVIIH